MSQKQLILFFFIILLSFKAMIADDECSSKFEDVKMNKCKELSDQQSNLYCSYIDNQCKEWYKECKDYHPESSEFDDNICKKIGSNSYKKCVVNSSNNQKSCIEEIIPCSERSINTCLSGGLADSNKRCVIKGGKCEEHSNSCLGLDSTKCEANIPSDFSKKCSFKDNTCNEEEKKCSDFVPYTDGNYHNCYSLKASSNDKVCYKNEDSNCAETYKSCEVVKTQTECEKNKLINNNIINNVYKCVWDSKASKCEEKQRHCSEYNKGQNNPNLCLRFTTEYPDYKMCIYYSTDECIEKYKSCDAYNHVVTEANKRKAEDCKAIEPTEQGSKKCVLNDNKECEEVRKECNDIKEEDECNSYFLEDTSKKCIFLKGECKEELKNCEAFSYNSALTSEQNKEKCESISPKEEDYLTYKTYKCIYSDSDHKCTKKEIEKCEDYTGYSNSFCTNIKFDGNMNFYISCTFKDNKCITQYNDCYYYNEIITDENKRKKEECEALVIESINKKCIFDDKKKICDSERLQCSEYRGTNPDECKQFEPKSDLNICVFENGKCTEKLNNDFKNCYEYNGDDKSICEAIQPRSNNGYYDYSLKCVYDKYDGCLPEKKLCSDAKNSNECSKITPSNGNKICIYKDNSCVERYKTCDLYRNSGEEIQEDLCESIIVQGEYGDRIKCEFSPGSCTSNVKTCSDFQIESFESNCNSLRPSLNTQKCTYSNKACTVTEKTCIDYFFDSSATKEICEAATASSSNKICVLKSSRDGCEEVNNPNGGGETNASREIYLNKILFALLCFLL